MMKVLHVVNSMDPVLGGVSKAVDIIASSLASEGIINEVVSLDHSEDGFVTNQAFKWHALGKSTNPWGYNSGLLPWLTVNVAEYDYVIIHGLWLYNSYAVYKAFKNIRQSKALSRGTKYLVMPHGMLDPYFQKASGRRVKAIRNWLYWKFIESKVVNTSDGLLFTCEEECKLAKEPFKPYNPKNEFIVGLGVEAPPEYHSKMDEAFFKICKGLENRPFLLFLSRINEKKGVDLLIEAYKKIILNPSAYFTTSVEGTSKQINKEATKAGFEIPALAIVGPGIETDYGQSLLKTINNHPELKNNIFFPGMLSGNAKWGAFYNSDAFVLPSHQENFGIAVVESLACKKPVLISNQINIWKEIKNTKAGLVENDTLVGTTTLLADWMNLSEENKEKMSRQAEVCYKTCFSIEALVTSWKSKVLDL
ncbi:glycosyltransferase involved in cell wall biosynthesis [Mariniflexile fucanivorans]|uniref:Glycosyltransferase involved in cell wall biosynthesis n=1 Tax=Mariniflexile fucanivorans TaxID=264023 RepID=A0A4R1RLP4_9FLAO|nr:glycosyltransferase [Mariniflexile fucanivorans]TCL66692.1 glycosyltransferase involved in cell wall biosynthesis [Mariniflexile fucanivorans]